MSALRNLVDFQLGSAVPPQKMESKYNALAGSTSVKPQNSPTSVTPFTPHPDLVLGLQNAIDQIDSYIFTKDMAGRYTYVNLKVQALFNCGFDDIVGKDDTAFFDLTTANDIHLNDRRVLDLGEVLENEEVAIVKSTGERRVYWSVKKPIKNKLGQISGMCGVSTDITELKITEEKLRQNAEALNNSQVIAGLGTYVLDINTGVWTSSLVLDQLFGIDASFSHTVASWEAMISPQDRTRMHDYFLNEVCGQGKQFDQEYRIIRVSDLAERWMHGLGRLDFNAEGRPIKMTGTIQDITERKIIEQTLIESESKFRALVEQSIAGIYIIQNGQLAYVNPSFARIFKFKTPEDIVSKVSIFDLVTPEDRELVAENIRKRFEEKVPTMQYRFKALCHDGSTIVVEVHGSALLYKGQPAVIGLIIDVTEQERAETVLNQTQLALETTHDGFLTGDTQGVVRFVNHAYAELVGYSVEELVGKHIFDLESKLETLEEVEAQIATLKEQGYGLFETRHRHKDGHEIDLEISAAFEPKSQMFMVFCRDISARKEAEKQIEQLAYYDFLTGLPNRRLLQDRLNQSLVTHSRNGHKGALLFIDLDNFKTINDTLGHDTGDLLLQQVAIRMQSCLREGDTISRTGGDEFVVMLSELGDQTIDVAANAQLVAEKILAALDQPYFFSQDECRCTCSIGITLFGSQNQSVETIMKQADIAMYQAKKSGRNDLRFFDPEIQASLNSLSLLEGALHNALENKELRLHYQLQVDNTGRALGAEALLRWFSPNLGNIPPAKFIPIAEENGLILPIGLWVLETACTQLKAWERKPATRDLVLSVNISTVQLRSPNFVNLLKAMLVRLEINPRRLKLELTESVLLENIDDTITKMHALKAVGVQFSLDDFGTGYSSLQYLRQLPIDQLKIDQSFVHALGEHNAKTIVRTIIAMAQSLNYDVIAEGVETEAQREILSDKGCIQYQGYLLGRPVSIEEFEHSLR